MSMKKLLNKNFVSMVAVLSILLIVIMLGSRAVSNSIPQFFVLTASVVLVGAALLHYDKTALCAKIPCAKGAHKA